MTYEAESPRLYLQRLSIEEHLEDFWEQWRNPRLVKWLGQEPKRTIEEARDMMTFILPSKENPNIDKFALLVKPDPANPQPWLNAKGKPKCIGVVGTNRVSDHGLETGFFVHPSYWGQGYASEGVAAFLKLFWALEERRGFGSIVAMVDPDNVASTAVVQKMGARKGGVLNNVWRTRGDDGQEQERDMVLWYMDRPAEEGSEG